MSSTLPLITVIVVNDQVAVCKLWQQIIDKTPGMSCPAYALDGENALQLVHDVRPDVVLSDMLMPVMRGDELMQQIQANYPEVIVILYSADQSTESIARNADATEFLLMPVTPSDLTRTIRHVYHDRHGQ